MIKFARLIFLSLFFLFFDNCFCNPPIKYLSFSENLKKVFDLPFKIFFYYSEKSVRPENIDNLSEKIPLLNVKKIKIKGEKKGSFELKTIIEFNIEYGLNYKIDIANFSRETWEYEYPQDCTPLNFGLFYIKSHLDLHSGSNQEVNIENLNYYVGDELPPLASFYERNNLNDEEFNYS